MIFIVITVVSMVAVGVVVVFAVVVIVVFAVVVVVVLAVVVVVVDVVVVFVVVVLATLNGVDDLAVAVVVVIVVVVGVNRGGRCGEKMLVDRNQQQLISGNIHRWKKKNIWIRFSSRKCLHRKPWS